MTSTQHSSRDPENSSADTTHGWIPRYQSIKQVQAFKIKSIVLVEGGYRLEAEDSPRGVVVDKAYFDKHQPKTGGYYVHYEDGYQSWSPALAFESGYVLIKEDHDIEALDPQHPPLLP